MKTKSNILVIGFILVLLFFSSFTTNSVISLTTQTELDFILITGFEPFANYSVNPSEQIALQLNNTTIKNCTIIGEVLPVNFSLAPEKMKQLIKKYDPILIISLGLSGKIKKIRVETIAINLRVNPDVRYPIFSLKKVNNTGPCFQIAMYDIDEIIAMIKEQDIPVEQGYSAGFYLCNAIMYETLFYQNQIEQIRPTGFIHVPLLKSQDSEGMPLEDMIQAIQAAISVYT